ncbi:MAG: alpha/beta fold hydrolase [Betaproteobacteria bacterium]
MTTTRSKSFVRTRWGWVAACITVLLSGGCAYLETKQGDWIFNPVQGEWRGYRGPPAGIEEVRIPVGNKGETLHAWWSPNDNPGAPVLLYLHGARWNLSGSVTRVPRWNAMGFSVLAIDYRGFGKSTFVDGGSPTEQSANEDSEAAWGYLSQRNPTAKKFIFGHSLGASMATHLALKEMNASGVILEGAFTSVPDMIKETKWGFLPVGFLVTQRFDTIGRIGGVKIPILFVHGSADNIVPFAMGEQLYAAAKAPKRLFRAEGGSHHNLAAAYFDDYQRAVSEHFGLHLIVPLQTRTSNPAIGSAAKAASAVN